MEINWIRRINKNDVYTRAMEYCEAHALTKANSSVLTLLLPPGNFSDAEEVQQYLSSLLQEFQIPAILSIEPVLPGNDMNTMSLLKIYGKYKTELLPFYHVHLLILDEELEKDKIRTAWNNVVDSKMKELFHCSHVESSIREVINYITKFFERKRGECGILGFVLLDDTKSVNETVENQTNSATILRKVKKALNTLFRISFQFPLVFVCQTGEINSLRKKSSRSP